MKKMSDWLTEYEILMFGDKHSRHTMDIAAELKYKYMPEILYKYRDCKQRNIDALKNDYQVCSDPIKFNDPFESPIRFLLEQINKKIIVSVFNETRCNYPDLPDKVIKKIMELLICNTNRVEECTKNFPDEIKTLLKHLKHIQDENLTEYIKALQRNTKSMYNICCLSSRYDITPMWSHYADDYRGFCIGYGIKELGLTNNLVQLTLPVIYRENETIEIDDIDYVDGSLGMYALSLKNIEWSYEHEWRIFSMNTGEHSIIDMPTPKYVILGCKMDDKNKDIIMSICAEKNIMVKKMILDNNIQKMITVDV